MAINSEDSTSQLKGLSFIDWESLDQDEFVKLEKIIHDSKESPGVQLPFVPTTPMPVKSSGNVVDIQASVLHPSAPVFQPAMPPPSIVSFPIPVPAWTHGEHNMASSVPPYHIPVHHGGYVFQDPGLAVNGEVTVAFVTTLSNGQPVYAFPGHQMPPTFQPPPHHQAERMNSTMAHVGHAAPCQPQQGDLMMQPVSVSGAMITPPSTHPLVMGHGNSNLAARPAPMVAPVTMAHTGLPHPQTTQMMYITQLPPTEPSPINVINSAPQIPIQPPGDATNTPVMSKAISGLPPRQKSPVIEFAGPVLFDVPATPSTSGASPKDEERAGKEPVSQKENSKPAVDSGSKIKKSSVTEVVIDVKCLEKAGQQPAYSPIVSGSSSSNAEPNPAIDSSSSVSSTPAKSPLSPASVNNVNSNFSDTANDFPKVGISHSPLSPSTLPQKDVKAKETLSKEVTAPPAPKMWSSLFGSKTDNTKSNTTSSAPARGTPVQPNLTPSTSPEGSGPLSKSSEPKSISYWQEQEKAAANSVVPSEKVKSVVAKQDPLAPRLLEKLSNFPISHAPIVIQPRGLKNGKNTCFMNATLQVLMGCPPFVHMFRAFKSFPARTGGCSSTPIFDSLVLFVNSFHNGQRAKQTSRGKKGNALDVSVGIPFLPEPLLNVAQDILGLNIGVQQDAEEFLSQILSICHEEMENIIKMDRNMDSVNNNSDTKPRAEANGHVDNFNHIEGSEDDDQEDDSWQRVGPKNHSVETNVNDCGQTPLSAIFAGLIRSCLQRESGRSSDTLDSFFTLKLDIQTESIHCVKEALLRLNTMEIVHDADGRKVHGQRRMFFDILPPVLIMHLKLFEYSNGNGQKIQKKISFDVDLQIPKEILSRVGRMKYSSPKARSYKLFGVVNHHGVRMNDGHYTSDVYLPVANGWLHFDDSEVTATNETQVLQYCERSMPYMLFYRRLDTKE